MRARSNPDFSWGAFLIGGLIGGVLGAGAAVITLTTVMGPAPAYSFNSANAIPVPIGQPVTVTVGSSILAVDTSGNALSNVTTSSPAVLAAAPPAVPNGFVALAPGTVTLTSTVNGTTTSSTVTVTPLAASTTTTPTGTSGVPIARPKKPPVAHIFGFRPPKRLAA